MTRPGETRNEHPIASGIKTGNKTAAGTDLQALRSALTNSFFFIEERPLTPTLRALASRSDLVHLSYAADLRPCLDTVLPEEPAAVAMRAAFAFLIPSRRKALYSREPFTLGPTFPFVMLPPLKMVVPSISSCPHRPGH
jgi:hypothetical protein